MFLNRNAKINITIGYLFLDNFIWQKYIQIDTCKNIVNNTQEGLCRKLGHICCYIFTDVVWPITVKFSCIVD